MISAPALGAVPLWVSIEGINGVGKTSAARAVAAQLGERCLLLDELTDSGGTVLHGRVITALSEHGDPFLRTGHPVAETLALFALQLGKAERLAGRDLTGVEVILEDRGLDSVAVYQAAILRSEHPDSVPEGLADDLLAGFRRWRGLADVTLLLTGDPKECARRFAARIGRALTPADLHLLNQIDALYRKVAGGLERYVQLDVTGMSQEETAGAVREVLAVLMDRQAAHAS